MSTRGNAPWCVTEGAQESTLASAPQAPGRIGARRCKDLPTRATTSSGPA